MKYYWTLKSSDQCFKNHEYLTVIEKNYEHIFCVNIQWAHVSKKTSKTGL